MLTITTCSWRKLKKFLTILMHTMQKQMVHNAQIGIQRSKTIVTIATAKDLPLILWIWDRCCDLKRAFKTPKRTLKILKSDDSLERLCHGEKKTWRRINRKISFGADNLSFLKIDCLWKINCKPNYASLKGADLNTQQASRNPGIRGLESKENLWLKSKNS